MQLTTRSAVAGVSAVSDASLTMRSGETITTQAPTGVVPETLDGLQYLYGGPCVDAAFGAEPFVHCEDLRNESRWPGFTAEALVQSPVLSIVSYRLWIGQDATIGSLNLYAGKPHAFDPDTIAHGQHLAAYAAVILANARQQNTAISLRRAPSTTSCTPASFRNDTI
jgi:GAF domain-containing protein